MKWSMLEIRSSQKLGTHNLLVNLSKFLVILNKQSNNDIKILDKEFKLALMKLIPAKNEIKTSETEVKFLLEDLSKYLIKLHLKFQRLQIKSNASF